MDVLQVPLHEPRQNADGVFVWECSGSALDEGDAPSKWFSDYLGKPNHLVRFNAVLLLKKSEMLSHGQKLAGLCVATSIEKFSHGEVEPFKNHHKQLNLST
ncbi:uncharacterized protein LOC120072503 isoform X2 [Benincasa hispida]|uniref:uncharacterized protein LOC120072503 isoform X2 n=1 Tax=Benincasa hispida TaxID=102211 RepID=UPI0018FF136C|nr:uncharacterized protein LOC120072503 isoform X2 [Benincasa hispida]